MEERSRYAAAIVLGVLLAVGIAGAATVYVVGSRTRNEDRRDFRRWESSALPVLDRLDRALAGLSEVQESDAEAGAPATVRTLGRLRREVERTRRDLLALRVERVVETPVTFFANSVAAALEAISAMQDRTYDANAGLRRPLAERARRAVARARSLFDSGRLSMEEIRKRLDLAPG